MYKKTQEFGVLNNKNNCVFLWLYTLDGTNHEGNTVPNVLLLARHDNTFGTVGGNVEAGETLLEALKRECFEELSLNIEPLTLNELATFESENMKIHSYISKISSTEMDGIIINKHFTNPNNEVAGLIKVQYDLFDDMFELLTTHPFTGSAGDELTLVRDKIDEEFKWEPEAL